MNDFKFMISKTEYIEVIAEPVCQDCCKSCAQCDIDYVDESKNIRIRFGHTEAADFYGSFSRKDLVKNLVENKQFFDEQVDLGFEWNQFFQGILKQSDILEKYYFSGNDHKQIRPYFNSWFYNDKDGNIIFEITPFYPFHYETKKTHPDFVTYKKWIKDYKVTVRKIIAKETLIAWNDQAKAYNHLYKKTLCINNC